MMATKDLAERLRALRISPEPDPEHGIWGCQIGEIPRHLLPPAADGPMRDAVADAFKALTGREPDYIFSGWGDNLSEGRLAVVENREPLYEKTDWATLTEAADALDRLSSLEQAEASDGLLWVEKDENGVQRVQRLTCKRCSEVESGSKGVTDADIDTFCNVFQPQEGNTNIGYQRSRVRAALNAVLGPRLASAAKAEARVKTARALCPRHGWPVAASFDKCTCNKSAEEGGK